MVMTVGKAYLSVLVDLIFTYLLIYILLLFPPWTVPKGRPVAKCKGEPSKEGGMGGGMNMDSLFTQATFDFSAFLSGLRIEHEHIWKAMKRTTFKLTRDL